MASVYVVTSKVKGIAKKKDLRMSGEFIEALSERVEQLVTGAMERCVEAKRKTVKDVDLE